MLLSSAMTLSHTFVALGLQSKGICPSQPVHTHTHTHTHTERRAWGHVTIRE